MPASEYSKIWASASLLVSFHLLGEVVHLKLLLILLVDAAILDHHRLGARRVIQAVAATACFLTLDKCLNAAFWYFFLSVVYCASASSNSNRVPPKPPPTVFTFFRSDSILHSFCTLGTGLSAPGWPENHYSWGPWWCTRYTSPGRVWWRLMHQNFAGECPTIKLCKLSKTT